MSTVEPAMRDGGNTSAQTAVIGSGYTTFASQSCKQLTLVNNTGTDIEFRQDAAGDTVPVINGTAYPIYGINNAARISVRRIDQSNTQVTLKARWES